MKRLLSLAIAVSATLLSERNALAADEKPSPIVSEYKSKLIKDYKEFYLPNKTFCSRHKNFGACEKERTRRENWNAAIYDEISRYNFVTNFKGNKSLVIPGKSEASGKYTVYGEWFSDIYNKGVIYIGRSRPFGSGTYLVPLAFVSAKQNSFTVPMYISKKGGYSGRADAKIHWVVVNCSSKMQFTNTVIYLKGNIKDLNVYKSYANNDRILDYNIIFLELKILMSNEYPFHHIATSPFNEICR